MKKIFLSAIVMALSVIGFWACDKTETIPTPESMTMTESEVLDTKSREKPSITPMNQKASNGYVSHQYCQDVGMALVNISGTNRYALSQLYTFSVKYNQLIPIKNGTTFVTNVAGLSAVHGKPQYYYVTTTSNSNHANRLLMVDGSTGQVLSQTPTIDAVNGAAIALKDIEASIGDPQLSGNSFKPEYVAIRTGTRDLYSVDVNTGKCFKLVTVPGSGVLHGLATDYGKKIWVMQSNVSTATCGANKRGRVWQYALSNYNPLSIYLLSTHSYNNTTAVIGTGEGGLLSCHGEDGHLMWYTNNALASKATGLSNPSITCYTSVAMPVTNGQITHDVTWQIF